MGKKKKKKKTARARSRLFLKIYLRPSAFAFFPLLSTPHKFSFVVDFKILSLVMHRLAFVGFSTRIRSHSAILSLSDALKML